MSHGNSHAQVQAEFIQLFADFIERRIAEVANFQELIFRQLYQIANGGDALRFEAIAGSHR